MAAAVLRCLVLDRSVGAVVMKLSKPELTKAKKNALDKNLGATVREFYKQKLRDHIAATRK